VLLNDEVKLITVPRLNELSAKNLLREALSDFFIRRYLPESGNSSKPLNR
jgi:hypothetical protein